MCLSLSLRASANDIYFVPVLVLAKHSNDTLDQNWVPFYYDTFPPFCLRAQ